MLVLAKAIASLGGVGYIRPASATWGSLATGIVLFFLFPEMTLVQKGILILVVFICGVLIADYIEKQQQLHDPHFIVIDEAVGMMITTLFLESVWVHFFLAFALFRIFDIAKLYPASIFDKRPGGFAAMIDDVIMAIPALAVLHLILYVI